MPINPAFIQALVGMGADLSAHGANTDKGFQPTNLNASTNQSIKANSFMKLMQNALSQDNSDLKLSKDGMTIKAGTDSELLKAILGGGSGGPANQNPPASTPSDQAAAPAATPTAQVPQMPNPFTVSQPRLDTSSSALAGLTPQDIAAVMGMKQAQDTLKQQSYKDTVDAIYKQSQMQGNATAAPIENAYKDALTKKALADIENDKAIYQVPGSDVKLNAKDWVAYQKLNKESQSAAVKNYEYAKSQGFTGDFVEFQDNAKTTHKKDYDEAVAGGYKGSFNNWMLEMAKAGAINLGGKLEEKKAMSELEGQLYFSNPKWTEDLNKQISNFVTKDLWEARDANGKLIEEKDRPLVIAKERVKYIEGKIDAGSGIIQSVTMDKDGKTMIWTVKWPSGDVKTIKQAVR